MEAGLLWATFCTWLMPWLQNNLATPKACPCPHPQLVMSLHLLLSEGSQKAFGSICIRRRVQLSLILPCLLYAKNVNNLGPKILYYRNFNCCRSADLTEMLVALFLIRDLNSESFPPESNREFLWIESNRNRECSNQIFAWSNQIPGAVKSQFKSNCDLDLPITGSKWWNGDQWIVCQALLFLGYSDWNCAVISNVM